MKILLTGSRGYIGRPLTLKLLKYNHKIIGIDNCAREKWVERVGGNNFKPFDIEDNNYNEIIGDLTDKDLVNEIFTIHKPEIVIHCASQPSLPYSQINWERALYTQINNLSMNLNLLWGIYNNGLNVKKYILLSTTGIPGQFYKIIPEDRTFNCAGSWYHISRGFDSDNCNLANRQWGIKVVEFRTSIIYGLQTSELKEKGWSSRFDTDFYFGTALNRFVNQALDNNKITVYGEGNQIKPFISLEDACQSIINAIDFPFAQGHTILNQTTQEISIKQLAELIAQSTGAIIEHIPNPRKEKEDWEMIFDNRDFLKVLGQPKQLIDIGIKEMIKFLMK